MLQDHRTAIYFDECWRLVRGDAVLYECLRQEETESFVVGMSGWYNLNKVCAVVKQGNGGAEWFNLNV